MVVSFKKNDGKENDDYEYLYNLGVLCMRCSLHD